MYLLSECKKQNWWLNPASVNRKKVDLNGGGVIINIIKQSDNIEHINEYWIWIRMIPLASYFLKFRM